MAALQTVHSRCMGKALPTPAGRHRAAITGFGGAQGSMSVQVHRVGSNPDWVIGIQLRAGRQARICYPISLLLRSTPMSARDSGKGKEKDDGKRSMAAANASAPAGGPAGADQLSPFRIVHRFVGEQEKQKLQQFQAASRGPGAGPQHSQAMADALTERMGEITAQDFAEVLHTHTMTPVGGGPVGGNQPLVSMTSNIRALRQSTDPGVQNIVQNAPFIASFSVPRGAAVGAPSDLSRHEREVVVPNDSQALPAMMFDVRENPYRAAHAAPAPGVNSSAMGQRKMSVTESKSNKGP